MNATITISNVGADVGPFNLYSDVDGYISAFESNIPTAILEAGFSTNNVPEGTTQIRVQSVNEDCNNSVNVGIIPLVFYFEPTDASTYVIDFVDNGTYAYVYGYFNGYFNGSETVPGNHIVKLNPDRSVDTSFDIGEGMNFHTVFLGASMIELVDLTTIYVGFFTTFNGETVNRILKLLPNGQRDTSFNTGTGFNNYTTSVQQDTSGRLYITGIYSTYNGVSSPRLIRLLPDGSVDTTYNVGSGFNNSSVYSLLNPDNSLYVSGYFTQYNGTSVPTGIVKIDDQGNIAPDFNGGSGFNVGNLQPVSLARITGETSFYAAGYFTTYKGISEPYIIKLLPNGDKDTSFNPGTGFNNTVSQIKVIWEDKLFVNGNFTEYNGIPVNGHIILNKDGTIYKAFDDPGSYPFNMYIIGNDVYASDYFDPAPYPNTKVFTYDPSFTTTTTTTV